MTAPDERMRCDVCGVVGATHEFDIVKESGASPIHTCPECKDVGTRLAMAVKDAFCLWCQELTGEKYEWLTYGYPPEPRHRICGDCRDEIVFTERSLTRGPRGGLK